jgi:hypothetical protein
MPLLETLLVATAVLAPPVLLVLGLGVLVDRREEARRQAALLEGQLIEAVLHEVGALAPVAVRRRGRGRWEVALSISSARPSLAARVAAIAHRVVTEGSGPGARIEIVVPRPAGDRNPHPRAGVHLPPARQAA